MVKTNLANKRVLVGIIFVILLAGLAVGAYFIFRPKIDNKGIVDNFYTMSTSKESEKFVANSNDVENLFSDLNSADASYFDEYNNYRYAVNSIKELKNYEKYVLEALSNIKDKDRSIIIIQKELFTEFEDINKIMEKSASFFDKHLDEDVFNNYDSTELKAQYLDRYSKYYFEYASSYSDLMENASKLIKNYAVETFSVNAKNNLGLEVITISASNVLDIIEAKNDGYIDKAISTINYIKNLNNRENTDYNTSYYDDFVFFTDVVNYFKTNSLENFVDLYLQNNIEEYMQEIKDEKTTDLLNNFVTNYLDV